MASQQMMLYVLLFISLCSTTNAFDRSFRQFYKPLWGFDHIKLLQDGDDELQLMLDKNSGAGFRSRREYLSGRFHVQMRLPKQKSRGFVPNFYMISENTPEAHCELDFEFFGTSGQLQTNVFANDKGKRERGFKLWFDPSEDFHSYTILWNSHQIVFLVDDIPITAFRNRTAIGANYPTCPTHIEATAVWAADWAGGAVDWSLAPFIVYYRNFTITGCPASFGAALCDSARFEWNSQTQWDLNSSQKRVLELVDRSSLLYGYCERNPSPESFPECYK